MLTKYLEEISNKNIPFIVLSSGISGKDVIQICQKFQFIKEVIIYCDDYNKYKHYLSKYTGYVKNIFVDIKQLYNYIKSFGPIYNQGIENYKIQNHFIFSFDDIESKKQLKYCPVISAYEYDNYYFLVHRAYAHFFENMNDKNIIFRKPYFNIIQENIDKLYTSDNKGKPEFI